MHGSGCTFSCVFGRRHVGHFFFVFFSLCGWTCLLIEGLPAAINTGMEDFPRLTDEEKNIERPLNKTQYNN